MPRSWPPTRNGHTRVVVLDAWALIALLEGDQSAVRVRDALDDSGGRISVINVGEARYILARRHGWVSADDAVTRASAGFAVMVADEPGTSAAAKIKAYERVSYADAFAVACAETHDEPLLTGDPEILALDHRSGLTTIDLRGS